jgi:hypothetical protein
MRTSLIAACLLTNVCSLSQVTTSVPVFSSLEPFVKGLEIITPILKGYRVTAEKLPQHIHPKPFIIVWLGNDAVREQKDRQPEHTRNVVQGQAEFYQQGTIHSLVAVSGALKFALIELSQERQSNAGHFDNKDKCDPLTDLPGGGFACLIKVLPDTEIANVSGCFVSLDSSKFRVTVPRSQWETSFPVGGIYDWLGDRTNRFLNKGPKVARLVFIVPPASTRPRVAGR